ncbi:conserved hypothetical protein [Halobacteriovorax marinus SJ]|uniref:Uncharacterized protein n=1 Tax=Halobacteriovorax marinus (strain ATCC BAA-682 / DSM 15412 / SJ) TaxID=862908 RepID=E1X5W4_HALMS|nr:AAA family ATPase [Halobacteriovorax marinus]CBW25681.1 conserved hypothetical protein [Halobacteriovorax marinus SJ]
MSEAEERKPRLKNLKIKNFRSIGKTEVSIDLDDIVVLIGPNNVGKSSILNAYELIMKDGSKECSVKLEDFHLKKEPESEEEYLEITLETIVYDNSPGDDWVEEIEDENVVKEKWIATKPGKLVRVGYNVKDNKWASVDQKKDKVPWGAANVANSRRPLPHKISPFDTPEKQTKEITDLVSEILDEKLREDKEVDGEVVESEYSKLLESIKSTKDKIINENKEVIEELEKEFTELIGKVFPKNIVKLTQNLENMSELKLDIFKEHLSVLMGPENGFLSEIARQGSGARRTVMWTALKILAEKKKSELKSERPHVLIIDEPEICLHPSAIRESCNVLYEIPEQKNWQVMLTTHSPVFVDLSKDNTSIVKVYKDVENEVIKSTTVFRTSEVNLSADDKTNLKLLNICDSYFTEFFFSRKIIVVEGDTEYTAFQCIKNKNTDLFKDVHIIRARGKAVIVSICKILNKFNAPYSVLHDADTELTQNSKKNPMWAINEKIYNEAKKSPKSKVIASLSDFEEAMFNESVTKDKPFFTYSKLESSVELTSKCHSLLSYLIGGDEKIPEGFVEWNEIEELKQK